MLVTIQVNSLQANLLIKVSLQCLLINPQFPQNKSKKLTRALLSNQGLVRGLSTRIKVTKVSQISSRSCKQDRQALRIPLRSTSMVSHLPQTRPRLHSVLRLDNGLSEVMTLVCKNSKMDQRNRNSKCLTSTSYRRCLISLTQSRLLILQRL